MKTLTFLKASLKIFSVASLSLLLSGCGLLTDTVIQTQYILPPAGLIVPCGKPAIIGTWPEVVTEDIPRLKSALSECATQADEYLKWRTGKEKPG